MMAHGDSNRRSAYEWSHLGETMSRHFNTVCSHLVGMSDKFITQLVFNTVSPVIANNRRFFSYFRVQSCYQLIYNIISIYYL